MYFKKKLIINQKDKERYYEKSKRCSAASGNDSGSSFHDQPDAQVLKTGGFIMITALVLFRSMALLLVIGVPISVSLGAAAMLSMLTYDVPLAVVGQRMFTALDSVSIMAIPFFVLAGNFMTQGGISRRLVDFANRIIGNVRGGMCYAMIIACAFFAALSGSAPATVLAIGSMLYPEMVKLGYPKERCSGLLTVAGGLGPIIPPSIIMVVYCTITNSSVGDMFKGGLVADAMIAVVLLGICIYLSYKEQWPKNDSDHSGIRKGQRNDVVYHCDLHRFFLAVYLLGHIDRAGRCDCRTESVTNGILFDCCSDSADIWHLSGGNCHLSTAGAGTLADCFQSWNQCEAVGISGGDMEPGD